VNRTRRICQWGAIAVLLALPMLSRGSALYQSFGPGARHVRELAGPWENFLYQSFSFLFGKFEDPPAIADLFEGSYWSITLFGVTISDPLALLGHSIASASIHWPLLAGAMTPVVIALLAGRAFCGWVCPVNTILEINAKLRRWLERRVLRFHLPHWTAPLRFRYLLLVAGIVISAASGMGAFALMLPYNSLARDWHLAVYGTGFGFGVLFIVMLMAIELLLAPRLWCRSLCPTGLVLGLLGKRRHVGIQMTSEGQCPSGCHLCAATCPVGVNPRDGINTEECLLCNECVAGCPVDVLAVGVSRRRAGRRRRAVSVPVLLIASLLPFAAAAHHIKGLPHYGYVENYPQIPTLEQHVSAPPFEFTVVTYVLDGLERQKSDTPNDSMVYVSIANSENGAPYTGQLRVTFRPLGGGAAIIRSFDKPLEETVYRMRVALPAESYDLEFRIGGDPVTVAQMRLSLTGGPNWWLVTSGAIAVLVLAGIGLIMLRRRRRYRRHALAQTR
jgi:ferredoxin-type protein NapH